MKAFEEVTRNCLLKLEEFPMTNGAILYLMGMGHGKVVPLEPIFGKMVLLCTLNLLG